MITATLENVSMCAVFDGHVSDKVSTYAQQYFQDVVLPLVVATTFREPNVFSTTIHQLFKTCDENVDVLGLSGGSTAAVAFFDSRTRFLYLVNLGDSRAVAIDVANGLWAATVDHKPNERSEYERIVDLGGYVSKHDTARVNGYLSVSRSLGDLSHRPFISSEPVVYGPYFLTGAAAIVLGSDGVFDVLSSEDIVKMVYQTPPKSLCHRIVSAALDKGSTDNITAVAMFVL